MLGRQEPESGDGRKAVRRWAAHLTGPIAVDFVIEVVVCQLEFIFEGALDKFTLPTFE